MVRVQPIDHIREHPDRGRRSHELYEIEPGQQRRDVHERDECAAADADDVVQVVPLKAVDDAAEDADRKSERDIHADDQEQRPRRRLLGRILHEVGDVEGEQQEYDVGDAPRDAEDAEQGARDFVQYTRVAPGAVVSHEPDNRPAEAEIEDREVRGQRRRQHPEPVRRRPQFPDIEGQEQEADDRIGRDREVPGRDVPCHRHERAVLGVAPQILRSGSRSHLAPFPNRITLTVSSTIVRSKKIERCLM